MTIADTMREVIALEREIMAALPTADAAAGDAAREAVRDAHDVLWNVWIGPGTRLDRLRDVAGRLLQFSGAKP